MKKRLVVLAGLLLLGLSVYSQRGEKLVKSSLNNYFLDFQTTYTTERDRCRIESVEVDAAGKRVEIYANELFAGQSFSREKVESIYNAVRQLLILFCRLQS